MERLTAVATEQRAVPIWDFARRVTVHSFRSTKTDFPGELAGMALAHSVGSVVERAYKRADLIAKRREMMAAWAKFATVTP